MNELIMGVKNVHSFNFGIKIEKGKEFFILVKKCYFLLFGNGEMQEIEKQK